MTEAPKFLAPRSPEFKTVKALYRRMTESKTVSVSEEEVPDWQRQLVWSPDDQGMLALSILQGYPIGLIVLWERTSGVRVPIDGRQRLAAIAAFMSGAIGLPTLDSVPASFRGVKYALLASDDPAVVPTLSDDLKDDFDGYELTIVQYDAKIPAKMAMDVFVRLQGGKPLTKTEVRAALGGRVCDFVTELTNPATVAQDEDDNDGAEEPVAHPFFQQLRRNLPNRRKAHRNVCDILLSEFLEPGSDKHWSSLEQLYREKAESLKDKDKVEFRESLSRFLKACTATVKGQKVLMPQLRTAFLILTIYRGWRELTQVYSVPAGLDFADAVGDFETQRETHKADVPWVNFTAALSNAGYAKNRSAERHDIFMSWLLREHPGLRLKDDRRLFNREQKLAIWYRAGKQCEWLDGGTRCPVFFADFRDADADHIVRWTDGGPTTVENGRLLCKAHNRAPRPPEAEVAAAG